jgi:hypothetical protein
MPNQTIPNQKIKQSPIKKLNNPQSKNQKIKQSPIKKSNNQTI